MTHALPIEGVATPSRPSGRWTEAAESWPRRKTYPLVGLLLALGAPGGLLLVRSIAGGWSPTPDRLIEELAGEPLTFAYMLLSTSAVFVALGFLLGRKDDRLRSMTMTEPLTGLFNRRYLTGSLAAALARARRDEESVSLLVIDVDRLKVINDVQGHGAGDRALIRVASAILENLRASDVAARHGGDEFAVLCPSTSATEAQALGDRIRESLSSLSSPGDPLTVSIGVADVGTASAKEADALFAAADRALYEAKAMGRDRTRLARTALAVPASVHAAPTKEKLQ
jgi:diguanylate cyclase (GGDEF)-like protein